VERGIVSRGRMSVLAGLALLFSGCGGDSPDAGAPRSVRVERPAFEGNRAFADLVTQVEFGPRFSGEPGHAAQIEWMRSELGALADTVYQDEFAYTTGQGTALNLTNVMARFGPDSGQPILLTTHWDTRPWATEAADEAERDRPIDGANDGASGVAVLMELARMFRAQAPPVGVIMLFSDGEDYGPDTSDMFLGAKEYVRARAAEDAPIFAILLDMVGDADAMFPVESYSAEAAPQVVQRVYGVAQELGYRHYFPMDQSARVIDDHLELNAAGIPTIDIIDFDYGPGHSFWHTAGDSPENTSAQTLAIVGDVVAEVVYRQR
jgi:Zn-dependent M28 family amino/carboxypeptidase